MKIGIVGYGYVGKAVADWMKGCHEILIHDPACFDEPHRFPFEVLSQSPFNLRCDVAFVCVPTPESEGGACDVSIVEEVVGWIETPLIIIKSTVPPGTTDRLAKETGKGIVFSPEYAGESKYWSPYPWHQEMIEAPWHTVGGPPELTTPVVDLYQSVGGPVKRYVQCTALEAELAKYMENAFYAAKITFCYEFAEICKTFGADYNRVREVWLEDPRINRMHTSVFPGNSDPFGGRCLPKDLRAIIHASEKAGFMPGLLFSVWAQNRALGKRRGEGA